MPGPWHLNPPRMTVQPCNCACFQPPVRPPNRELLARAHEIVERRKNQPPPTEEEIIAGGVAFVMGPGGDEGTRHRPDPLLARYGPTRGHPGDPGPRPDERPWVGKAKRKP